MMVKRDKTGDALRDELWATINHAVANDPTNHHRNHRSGAMASPTFFLATLRP